MRMTEQDYSDVAAACDRLLRAPHTSLARLAIPMLHFLNEHPSSLAQYAPLVRERSDLGFPNIPRAMIRATRGLARSTVAPRQAPARAGSIDVLIVSHLLKPEQLQRENDFFFGDLQRRLQDRGATSLLVLINHLPHAQSTLTAARQPPPFPRMILPQIVSPGTEINIWQQCASACRALRQEANSSPSRSIDSRLAILASHHALSAAAAINLRMHASLANLCQALNPKIVVTTYEGSAVERLVWHAARTARRRPLCVGYQHTLLFERAHAVRRPVSAPGIDCDPDVILTVGAVTHETLAASPELRSVPLIEYGSHRRIRLPVLRQPRHRPVQCLVLPDASDQECSTLFDFAIACARQRTDVCFALRPHPMVDTRSLLRRHRALQKLPENVSLSIDKPLEQELAQARYCLYRGSSAALHAALAGIKPYYLARPGELPFDCLFRLSDWRETVTSPEDLAKRMSLTSLELAGESAGANRARDLCERHIAPVRQAAIDELLAMSTNKFG